MHKHTLYRRRRLTLTQSGDCNYPIPHDGRQFIIFPPPAALCARQARGCLAPPRCHHRSRRSSRSASSQSRGQRQSQAEQLQQGQQHQLLLAPSRQLAGRAVARQQAVLARRSSHQIQMRFASGASGSSRRVSRRRERRGARRRLVIQRSKRRARLHRLRRATLRKRPTMWMALGVSASAK